MGWTSKEPGCNSRLQQICLFSPQRHGMYRGSPIYLSNAYRRFSVGTKAGRPQTWVLTLFYFRD